MGNAPIVRTLVWGAGWNTVGLVGAAAFNMLATIIVTRHLGVEGYARYSYLLWLASIGSLVAGAGLARPVARFVAKARGEGRGASAAQLVWRASLLTAALGLGLGLALALGAHRLHPGFVIVPAALLVANVVCGAVSGIQTAALQGEMAFRGLAVANVLSGVALFLGSVACAVGRSGAEQQYAVAVAAALGLVGLQGLLLARHAVAKAARDGDEPFRISGDLRDYWLAAVGLTFVEAIVWQRPEVLFLASYSSPEQLGYYNAAWALSSRLMQIATFVSPVLLAQLSGMRQSEEASRMQSIYWSSSRWLCLLATPGFLLAAGLAAPVVRLLFGPAYEPAALTLSILLLGALVATVSVAGSAVIYGTDRMGFALRLGAAAAVTTLSLDFILIPFFGAPGAAVASVGGQLVAIGATMTLSLTPSGFLFPWWVWARTLAAGIVAAAGARLVERVLSGTVGLMAAGFVGLSIYVGAVLVLRVLHRSDLQLVMFLLPGLEARSGSVRALLSRCFGPRTGDRS